MKRLLIFPLIFLLFSLASPLVVGDFEVSYPSELTRLNLSKGDIFRFNISLQNSEEEAYRVSLDNQINKFKLTSYPDNFILNPGGDIDILVSLEAIENGAFNEVIDIYLERTELGSYKSPALGVRIKGYIKPEKEKDGDLWWAYLLAALGAIGGFLIWLLKKKKG